VGKLEEGEMWGKKERTKGLSTFFTFWGRRGKEKKLGWGPGPAERRRGGQVQEFSEKKIKPGCIQKGKKKECVESARRSPGLSRRPEDAKRETAKE